MILDVSAPRGGHLAEAAERRAFLSWGDPADPASATLSILKLLLRRKSRRYVYRVDVRPKAGV